jgi:hypothetical protein
MWKDDKEMESQKKWAFIKTIAFLFCSVNLLISIILTITTSPGYIPEDTEWDMPVEFDSSGTLEKPIKKTGS